MEEQEIIRYESKEEVHEHVAEVLENFIDEIKQQETAQDRKVPKAQRRGKEEKVENF